MPDVDFCGESFALSNPGHYAMQDILELAEQRSDTEGAAGFRAITNLIRACMDEESYARWESVARKHRSTGEEMIRVVLEGLTDRPTSRPSDSSAGPPSTAPSSTDASSSRALQMLHGRPDLQNIVVLATEARAAS